MIQPWFSEAKLGIFIHWGIYAVKPTGESWPFFLGEISHEDYMAQRHGFTAQNYDPRAWADLFRDAGARYAVLTTKHHDGFALWDTQASDLSAPKASPAGRDLIAPYVQAMREAGLRVGLYFSHLDWSHPDYATLPKDVPPSDHGDASAINPFNFREHNPEKWQRFLGFHRTQIRELCHRFQPDLLWFDGDWDRTAEQWKMAELRAQIHSWSPTTVLNSRMKGHGDYETPEQGIPISVPKGPWEFCMTLNDHWGYMDSDRNYKSIPQLIWYFVQCFSRGGNLLLDIGPRQDGTIPEEAVARLRGLGHWAHRHSAAIYPTLPGLPAGHYDGSSTKSADGKSVFLFHFGPPTVLALKGVHTPVSRATVVGHPEQPLVTRKLGGASWSRIPGVSFFEVPEALADPVCTVVHLEFQDPVELYRGASGAIEVN